MRAVLIHQRQIRFDLRGFGWLSSVVCCLLFVSLDPPCQHKPTGDRLPVVQGPHHRHCECCHGGREMTCFLLCVHRIYMFFDRYFKTARRPTNLNASADNFPIVCYIYINLLYRLTFFEYVCKDSIGTQPRPSSNTWAKDFRVQGYARRGAGQ